MRGGHLGYPSSFLALKAGQPQWRAGCSDSYCRTPRTLLWAKMIWEGDVGSLCQQGRCLPLLLLGSKDFILGGNPTRSSLKCFRINREMKLLTDNVAIVRQEPDTFSCLEIRAQLSRVLHMSRILATSHMSLNHSHHLLGPVCSNVSSADRVQYVLSFGKN